MNKIKFICENILCPVNTVEYETRIPIEDKIKLCPHCKLKLQRVL